MDTATGDIYYDYINQNAKMESGEEVIISDTRARFMKLIPEKYLSELQGMKRKERREFYRRHKKEFMKSQKEGGDE